jgi:hypothetical protein
VIEEYPEMSVQTRPNGHAAIATAENRCPVCEQPLTTVEQIAAVQGSLRARDIEVERRVEAQFSREIARMKTANKGEVATAVKAAVLVAETKLAAVRSQQETVVSTRLAAQRERLERAAAKAVSDEKAKAYEEKLRLEEKLQELTRQLQRKTPHELGEPAEVDLFEQLVAAFPSDRVSRVVKGVRGPDVLVEVIDHDEVVGSIVLDSKNHARWSNKFTSKLRSDQLAERADHAILSSSVMPAGARQLHVQDNVIVADPARVVVLVHLLRKQIVDNFRLKLGAEARNEKADKLYSFILSPTCDDLFDRLLKLTRELQDLSAAEERSHRTTWAKRAELVLGVVDVHDTVTSTIANVIGGGQ